PAGGIIAVVDPEPPGGERPIAGRRESLLDGAALAKITLGLTVGFGIGVEDQPLFVAFGADADADPMGVAGLAKAQLEHVALDRVIEAMCIVVSDAAV